MKYLYQIAGIEILCDLPFELNIRYESLEFLRPLSEDEGILWLSENHVLHKQGMRFFLTKTTLLSQNVDNGVWISDSCYIEQGQDMHTLRRTSPGKDPYICITRSRSGRDIVAEYLEGYEKELCYSNNLFDLLSMETILLQNQGLLLHSSFISWNGKGILFSAPSGTGKSTQASLWEKYESAEVLNGDRCGLRKMQTGWVGYGLPYAGSSHIFKNQYVSINAIVVLRQADYNQVQFLNPIQALSYLYPEFSIHSWDKEYVNTALELIQNLVMEIPIMLLECKPDQEAVQVLRDKLVTL